MGWGGEGDGGEWKVEKRGEGAGREKTNCQTCPNNTLEYREYRNVLDYLMGWTHTWTCMCTHTYIYTHTCTCTHTHTCTHTCACTASFPSWMCQSLPQLLCTLLLNEKWCGVMYSYSPCHPCLEKSLSSLPGTFTCCLKALSCSERARNEKFSSELTNENKTRKVKCWLENVLRKQKRERTSYRHQGSVVRLGTTEVPWRLRAGWEPSKSQAQDPLVLLNGFLPSQTQEHWRFHQRCRAGTESRPLFRPKEHLPVLL